jgi:hypothetical protein
MKTPNAYSRRKFLEFMGWGTAGVVLVPSLMACGSDEKQDADASGDNKHQPEKKPEFRIPGIDAQRTDDVVLAAGLSYYVLVSWGDALTPDVQFGFNNDFTCFVPVNGDDDGILWVNHEYIDEKYIHGRDDNQLKSLDDVKKEMKQVGGSLLRVRKENGKWSMVENDPYNREVSGATMIPFNWDHPIQGAKEGMGTLANCSGGLTPWGTILTCEENYDLFYGEAEYTGSKRARSQSLYLWEKFFPMNQPEHYGWVVEVDPKTGSAQKHIALGRCAHECCTLKELSDKRVVAYTGDDANDECLYKFVSSKPGSLKEGTLYVANLDKGEWVPIDWNTDDRLKKAFADQTETLVRVREAARIVGGTLLDRPEDIEIDPETGAVLVTLTNNIPKENYHGSILKIEEAGNDHSSLTFTHSTLLAGGEETGFACPDNMAFDAAGNLWFTSDIAGSYMKKPQYEAFGNNGLFLVPKKGPQAGEVIQIASAPVDAEFTGPWFAPDGKTLFLSVQHPGEHSESVHAPSSHWPEGGDAMPKPSVICIEGELLSQITSI